MPLLNTDDAKLREPDPTMGVALTFLTAALALGPRPRRMPRRVVLWGGD